MFPPVHSTIKRLFHQVFDFGSSTYWHLNWHSRTPQSPEDPPPSWCTSVHVVFPALDQQSPPCLWIDWLASFIDACRCYKASSPDFLVDWLEDVGEFWAISHRVTSLPTNTHYLLFKHTTLCKNSARLQLCSCNSKAAPETRAILCLVFPPRPKMKAESISSMNLLAWDRWLTF